MRACKVQTMSIFRHIWKKMNRLHKYICIVWTIHAWKLHYSMHKEIFHTKIYAYQCPYLPGNRRKSNPLDQKHARKQFLYHFLLDKRWNRSCQWHKFRTFVRFDRKTMRNIVGINNRPGFVLDGWIDQLERSIDPFDTDTCRCMYHRLNFDVILEHFEWCCESRKSVQKS